MPSMATDSPQRHRLTVQEYYRMAEAGILRQDARVELIEGEIIDMAPTGSAHAGTVDQLAQSLQRAVHELAQIRIQNPLFLDDYSEPEPDIAVLRSRADFYKTEHPRPADVLLIVEVADTSLHYDLEKKLPLYARYGIPEVWVVDLQSRRLIRHRVPREGAYTQVDGPDVTAQIPVGGLDDVSIELAAIFADPREGPPGRD